MSDGGTEGRIRDPARARREAEESSLHEYERRSSRAGTVSWLIRLGGAVGLAALGLIGTLAGADTAWPRLVLLIVAGVIPLLLGLITGFLLPARRATAERRSASMADAVWADVVSAHRSGTSSP